MQLKLAQESPSWTRSKYRLYHRLVQNKSGKAPAKNKLKYILLSSAYQSLTVSVTRSPHSITQHCDCETMTQ